MVSHLVRTGLLAAPLLAAATNPPTTGDIVTCCNSLSLKFGEKLAFDSDARYSDYNERYAENAQGHPTCIFLPTTSDDVAAALGILITDSRNLNTTCPFAIKSGGLSTAPGANDIQDGITFDLSWINSTTVSDDRSSVRLGTGATWSEVFKDLDGTGLAVPGGDPEVGVGGMALAGGMSWFTPRVGLLSDNIINIELILASGMVHNVNATHDPELFLALMGGGSNFGIVTYIDVKPFEQGSIWGGIVKYPLSVTSNALSAFSEFVSNSSQDPGSMALLAFTFAGPEDGEGDIMAIMIDADDDLTEHTALDPLLDVEPRIASQLAESPICEFETYHSGEVNRSLLATVTIKNDATILEFVHDYTNALIREVQYNDTRYVVGYQPLAASYSHNNNVLGLNYTKEDLIVMVFNPYWDDPELDFLMYTVAENWVLAVQEWINVSDTGVPFEFTGYAAPFQNPLASYGASNLQFLKDVAKEYDPDGVFQRFVPGGFKLS